MFAALQLKRARPETAASARQAFIDFFEREGARHFRIEEELLLPAYARHAGSDEPAIVRVDASGAVEVLDLADVEFARATLPNAPDPNAEERGRSLRSQAITDLVFADGRLFVAGLSNEEFSSRLIAIPVPFSDEAKSASLEFYHGSHGRFETRSPIRTFIATKLQGEPHLMAAYTCTPLVKIPVAELQPGAYCLAASALLTLVAYGWINIPVPAAPARASSLAARLAGLSSADGGA